MCLSYVRAYNLDCNHVNWFTSTLHDQSQGCMTSSLQNDRRGLKSHKYMLIKLARAYNGMYIVISNVDLTIRVIVLKQINKWRHNLRNIGQKCCLWSELPENHIISNLSFFVVFKIYRIFIVSESRCSSYSLRAPTACLNIEVNIKIFEVRQIKFLSQ